MLVLQLGHHFREFTIVAYHKFAADYVWHVG